jgi:hypothetical protein
MIARTSSLAPSLKAMSCRGQSRGRRWMRRPKRRPRPGDRRGLHAGSRARCWSTWQPLRLCVDGYGSAARHVTAPALRWETASRGEQGDGARCHVDCCRLCSYYPTRDPQMSIRSTEGSGFPGSWRSAGFRGRRTRWRQAYPDAELTIIATRPREGKRPQGPRPSIPFQPALLDRRPRPAASCRVTRNASLQRGWQLCRDYGIMPCS